MAPKVHVSGADLETLKEAGAMSTLERAILLAVKAHDGRRDKAGAPYVLHPLRLMLRMPSHAARIVAVLHDVVEDSDFSLEDLRRQGFSEDILDAVACLTRIPGEPYEESIGRAGGHPLARLVKIADLEDNMDVRRLANLGEKDMERLARYHRNWLRLRGEEAVNTEI
jgi:(p)ppGpp synthase/HD superfamily hydrolase